MSEYVDFDSVSAKLKKRGFPFLYIERNIYGVDYQAYIPETSEFEKEDAENLREGLLKVLEILDEEINK